MLRSEFRTVPSSRPDRVGLIRYQWGFALRLEDSCFAKSDLSPCPIHCRRHRRRRMMLAFYTFARRAKKSRFSLYVTRHVQTPWHNVNQRPHPC